MQYAAFDVGNVILHADFEKFTKPLSKSVNISLQEANNFVSSIQKSQDLGLNNVAHELRNHFKIKSELLIDDLVVKWRDIITVNERIHDMLLNLLNQDVKLAFLSNVGVEHAIFMKSVLSCFNGINFFSCEVGARKPSMLYYHTFLQLYPEWKECPYFDDVQENLDAGSKFGFKPFKFSLEESAPYGYVKSEKIKEMEDFILNS